MKIYLKPKRAKPQIPQRVLTEHLIDKHIEALAVGVALVGVWL